jgi:hypothetical protein
MVTCLLVAKLAFSSAPPLCEFLPTCFGRRLSLLLVEELPLLCLPL